MHKCIERNEFGSDVELFVHHQIIPKCHWFPTCELYARPSLVLESCMPLLREEKTTKCGFCSTGTWSIELTQMATASILFPKLTLGETIHYDVGVQKYIYLRIYSTDDKFCSLATPWSPVESSVGNDSLFLISPLVSLPAAWMLFSKLHLPTNSPPLNEGESMVSRILQLGPQGTKFIG